jgi:sugar phosphate isomerase/epimerase
MHRLAPRLIMMAVKDFLWQKTPKGWRVEDAPLGEGMIHLDHALEIAKASNFTGPVSLHMEYMHNNDHTPPIDSEADRANIKAIRKDWQTLKSALNTTGLL